MLIAINKFPNNKTKIFIKKYNNFKIETDEKQKRKNIFDLCK